MGVNGMTSLSRSCWRRLVPLTLASCLLATAKPATAENPTEALRTATAQIASADQDISSIEAAVKIHAVKTRTAEQRIADAVLLMGVKDYERAADVLNEVVEQYPQHKTAFADGLNMLGETYFLSKQYLSSRRAFRKIIDRGSESRFAPIRERAVIRLVDIALRLKDFKSLDRLFAKVGGLGTAASSGLAYAKGKGLLAQGKLQAASASLQAVQASSQFAHQARYLMGVIATTSATPPPPPKGQKPKPVPAGRYAAAVQRFQDVTKLPGDTAEHRHVIDLAWLAIGRLLYESSQWTQAVESYNRIGRTSPEFGTMLYELAWVYVRFGDFVRAQRALEVLAVAAPNSHDVADGSLLRADLMLRAGQFDKSRKVYESVRGTYESMRERIDKFIGSTKDPGVYFDTLSSDQLELFESGVSLPTLVLRWAREGEDGATAFAVIDDVAMCRRLIKESNEMIERLNAVLSSPNKIRAVPGLKSGAERALGLLNALAMARLKLAHGMDDTSSSLSTQLRQVRAQRKALEKRLGLIPVTPGDFATRERQAKRQWNQASQALQRIELEIDTLQATINGLERILSDGPQSGVVRSPQQLRQFRTTLDQQKRLVKQYREMASQFRRSVEAGKIQVGFGDKRFVEDEQVRKQFAQLLWQEVQLAQGGAGGAALATYARKLAPVLTKADATDRRVEAAINRLKGTVKSKVSQLRAVVRRETQNIVGYSLRLEKLDQEARHVVGGVAMRNFGRVRDRLKNIVLRADVGITEEAWEVREEQLTRVRRLKVERARSEQRLQEELDEVLDDSGDPEDE